MSVGAGGGEQTSNSRPLSPGERAALYNQAVSSISSTNMPLPRYQEQTYTDPGAWRQVGQYVGAGAYTDPGAFKQMSDGDYARLERNLLASQTSGLDRAKQVDTLAADTNLAKRGIWSSGLAERALNDINERYAASYLKAGADAANQRYGMQQNDNTAMNQYNLNSAQGRNAYNAGEADRQNSWNNAQTMAQNDYNLKTAANRNSFNADEASRRWQAEWQPITALSNLWNSTNGQVSNSNGWNANASFSY